MSAANAPFGVVNPDLRVKGVVGLRVIDASIMVRMFLFNFLGKVVDIYSRGYGGQPFIPSAHTQAPVYAIAERGADLVKTFWNVN